MHELSTFLLKSCDPAIPIHLKKTFLINKIVFKHLNINYEENDKDENYIMGHIVLII